MSEGSSLSRLQQRIAEEKAKRADTSEPKNEPKPEDKYAYLAPEPDFEPDPLDDALKNLSIIDAYNLWCGKSTPKPRPGQVESIMISCPKPNHPDKVPSAWLNTQLNTWYCGGCQEGGDAFDIAAYHFNITNYKSSGPNFRNLRKAMADSLGIGITKIGRKEVSYLKAVPDPEPEEKPEEAPPPVIESDPKVELKPAQALVKPPAASEEEIDAELAEVIALGEDQIIFPTLDWRKVVTPGTFLDDYMKATTIDDIAEEYHFWNALIALGLSAGRDAYLRDSPAVYGNLFVCLLGFTGDGKSRSMRHLRTTLEQALPYKGDEDYPKGVNLMPTPASGEALISLFNHPVYDPTNPKLIVDNAPIRGLVEFGEMAELAAKGARMGNILKPVLIDFYDMKNQVSTISKTAGTVKAIAPFCSFFTTTQPELLKDILGYSDKASGFLNRWVFASGKPKRRSFFQEDVVDVTPAIESLRRVAAWVGFGKEITVDPDAISILEEFYRDSLSHLLRSSDAGMLSRLPLLYKKLLLLFAINEHRSVVTPEIADKIISLHQYSIESYSIPSKQIGSDNFTNIYNELSTHIYQMTARRSEGPSLSNIKRAIKAKNYPIQYVERAISLMEKLGEIVIESSNSGRVGRPTVRYRWIGSAPS